MVLFGVLWVLCLVLAQLHDLFFSIDKKHLLYKLLQRRNKLYHIKYSSQEIAQVKQPLKYIQHSLMTCYRQRYHAWVVFPRKWILRGVNEKQEYMPLYCQIVSTIPICVETQNITLFLRMDSSASDLLCFNWWN